MKKQYNDDNRSELISKRKPEEKKVTQYNYVKSPVVVANDSFIAESPSRRPDEVTGLKESLQHITINHVSSVLLPRLRNERNDIRVSSLKEVLDAECNSTTGELLILSLAKIAHTRNDHTQLELKNK